MDHNMLALLQLCDSSFPTGAFSHSFGLETYIQDNLVRDTDTFSKWMKAYIEQQMVYTDGLACRLAYEALEEKRLADIWELDRRLMVQMLAEESREGSRRIGERFLTLGNQLYPSSDLTAYKEEVNNGNCYSHPAIAFAMIGNYLDISKYTTVISYLSSSITGLIQNAVRGIPLGQTDGQMLIKEAHSLINKSWHTIEDLTIDDLGIAAPGIEISQMRHERLNIRIFMS